MRNTLVLSILLLICISDFASADIFGLGANRFEIDFVLISGDASSANGTNIGVDKPDGFIDPEYGFRIGMYEITNHQWDKFQSSYGTVAGRPSGAYDENPYWTGTDIPTNNVSWYEAAQFVNWLNTSTGNPAAYKFTGTQGTGDYTLSLWESGDAGYNPDNPYRNSNALYFIPTEDEWVKAAYWNGTNLQTWASKGDVAPTQSGWNIYENGYATVSHAPWDVGSGLEELNGTFDMMGNVWEWMESPYYSDGNLSCFDRGMRGGAYITGLYYTDYDYLSSSYRNGMGSLIDSREVQTLGFRVASVPEPVSLLLLGLGGLIFQNRKRSNRRVGFGNRKS